MAELRRILFVDNENTVLRELETGLAAMRGQWQMEFISDARAALQRLDEERFDALIADPCLSGKDGASLLAEAAQRHPPLVRIVLAGPSERSAALDALAVAHQVLAKPCDPAELRATIGRALALRKFLGGDTPLKALVSRLDSLPSMPALYRRIVEELQSAHASFESVAAIIGQDPPMAAKIWNAPIANKSATVSAKINPSDRNSVRDQGRTIGAKRRRTAPLQCSNMDRRRPAGMH